MTSKFDIQFILKLKLICRRNKKFQKTFVKFLEQFCIFGIAEHKFLLTLNDS